MILKNYCPVCKLKVTLKSESYFENNTKVSHLYSCGHSRTQSLISSDKTFEDFISEDGHKPRKFQIFGANFALKSNGRFLLMDEQGIGKTIQFLMFCSELLKQSPKSKIAIIPKSSLRIQWMREIHRWLPGKNCQILRSESDMIMPGAKFYIISMDILWRFKDLTSLMNKLRIDCICLDECQYFKNADAKRTKSIQIIARDMPFIAALSGTPIKNNAHEFFPILNILRPDKFSSLSGYEKSWLQFYYDGYKSKYGGISNPELFKDYTKDFILRRTRAEVLPDLPLINREYMYVELGEEVELAYKNELKRFQEEYSKDKNKKMISDSILAYLVKMRHITGMAKIIPAYEFIKEFLESTDRKLTVFCHHHDVASTLYDLLSSVSSDFLGEGIINIVGKSTDQRQSSIDVFKNNINNRILIASTLASGEGLNLQFCSDAIMLEREWNPANEEQPEGRFLRIGQQAKQVNMTYFIAVGTIDEYITELVERKRQDINATLEGKEQLNWTESNIIKELADILAEKGGSKWGF